MQRYRNSCKLQKEEKLKAPIGCSFLHIIYTYVIYYNFMHKTVTNAYERSIKIVFIRIMLASAK